MSQHEIDVLNRLSAIEKKVATIVALLKTFKMWRKPAKQAADVVEGLL